MKRKDLTDLEVAIALKEYEHMMRRLEGSAERYSHPKPMAHCAIGWTQQKTADDFGISRRAVGTAIKIATAVEDAPEVAVAIKEYDELKRELEGSARRGERTDLTSLHCNEVWTQEKTAVDLEVGEWI